MTEDLKPREAVLALGLVTGEEYDCWTDPLKMMPSLDPEAYYNGGFFTRCQ
jgi:hypothetical protein